MKHEGIIKIEDIDKDLVNPTLEVKSVYVECLFTCEKTGNKYSRFIAVDLNTLDLIKAIESNKTLCQFA